MQSANRLARPNNSTATPQTAAALPDPAPANPATTEKVVVMPSLPP